MSLNYQEIRKAAEERRREKLETKAAKERVKAQIEADRRARKEREEEERRRQQGGETDPVQSTPAAVAVQPPQAKPAEPGKYESARIQVGQTIQESEVEYVKPGISVIR